MKITTTVIATILVTRIFVLIAANMPTLLFIFDDQSYHFYYGLALVIPALVWRRVKYAHIFFGIGVGLFIDDIGAFKYVITASAQTPIQDYWSPLFIIPLVVGLFALIISEKQLQDFFPVHK